MKRRLGCGPGMIGLGLIIGFAFGEHYLAMYIDKRRFPWAYANSGTPPLVGTWVGPFTTRSGKRLAMLLELQLVPLGRDGKSAISKSDDPDTGLRRTPLTLRRGTDAAFTALCSQLH